MPNICTRTSVYERYVEKREKEKKKKKTKGWNKKSRA